MIAYSRGSRPLAGAASLKHRMPAMISFGTHFGQWLRQQPVKLPGSNPDNPTIN
jgi:hypothetical protein